MTSIRRACGATLAVLAIAVATVTVVAGAQPSASPSTGAKTWIGRTQEMEAHLRTASVERMEETRVGVTRPRRATLRPGGPFDALLWKPLPPGIYRGFRESYKSEIAAYELDKLLELNMVPPSVERTIDGTAGAAVMWIATARSFADLGGAPSPPARNVTAWNRQIVRAKMFDNLIGNKDPNLGNWLIDDDWNVLLVDHSRAFGTERALIHKLTRVQIDLWTRIGALTEAQIASSPVGQWLDANQIRAMFERRAAMQKVVDDLVKRLRDAAYMT